MFALAAAVASIVTPLTITLSQRLRLLDEPDARKVHASATPRLGGIGIFAGVLIVGLPAFLIVSSWPDVGRIAPNQHLALLLGATFVFIIGLLDDITPVSSRYKLFALLAASAVVCGSGGALDDLRFSGNSFVEFHWVSWLVTIVWITGFAVAFNFIDGLDGLAGGLALLGSCTLAYFLLDNGSYVGAIAPLVLAGSLLGFLRFNWNPAKTFMGDGGSMTVGFLLGAMTIISNPTVGTMRSMFVPGLALSVAFVDTALTLFRRRYEQRRSMFAAERGHIHHRLLDRGFSHVQAVQLIHAVSIAAVLIGFMSLAFEGWATLGGISLLLPLLGVFFHFAGSIIHGRTALF
ncbi:MAG: MraY family glycosyltransferase [Planctomycetota bacterium]